MVIIMAEITQWELSKLKDAQKDYYDLLQKFDALCDALTPVIERVILNLDDEALKQLKERMEH